MASLRRPIARFRPYYPSPSVYLSAYRRYLGGLVPGNGPPPIGFASYLEWLENKLFLNEQEATAAFQALWQVLDGSWNFTPSTVTHSVEDMAAIRTVSTYYHCDFQFQLQGTGQMTAGIQNSSETLQGIYVSVDGGAGTGRAYLNNTPIGTTFSYTADSVFIISSVKGAFTVTKDGVEIASGTSPAGPFYAFMTSGTRGDTLVAPSFLLVYVRWWLLAGGANEAPEWALSKVSAFRKASTPATAMWLGGEENVRITFTPSNVTESNSLLVGLTRDILLDPSFGQAIRFSPGRWEALPDGYLNVSGINPSANISGTWQEGDIFQISSGGGLVTYTQSGNTVGSYDTDPAEITKYGFVQPSIAGTGVTGWVDEYFPPPFWRASQGSHFENLDLSSGVSHIVAANLDRDYVYSSSYIKSGDAPASNVSMVFRVTNLTDDADVGFIQNTTFPNSEARLFFNNTGKTFSIFNTYSPAMEAVPTFPLSPPWNGSAPFNWSNGSRIRLSLFNTATEPYLLLQDASTNQLIYGTRIIPNFFTDPTIASDARLEQSRLPNSSNRPYAGFIAAPNSISFDSIGVTSATLSDWVAYPGVTLGSNSVSINPPYNDITAALSTATHFNSELLFRFAISGGYIILSNLYPLNRVIVSVVGSKLCVTDITNQGSLIEVATASTSTVYSLQMESDASAAETFSSRYVISTVSGNERKQLYAVPLIDPNAADGIISPARGPPYHPLILADANTPVNICNLSFSKISNALPQTRWRITRGSNSSLMATDQFVMGNASNGNFDNNFVTRKTYTRADVSFSVDPVTTYGNTRLAFGWTAAAPSNVGSFNGLIANGITFARAGASNFPSFYIAGAPTRQWGTARVTLNLSGTTVNYRIVDDSNDMAGTLTASDSALAFVGAAYSGTNFATRNFQLSGTPVPGYWFVPAQFDSVWDTARTSLELLTSVSPPNPIPYAISKDPSNNFAFNFTVTNLLDTSGAEAEVGLTTLSSDISNGALVRVQMYRDSSDNYFYKSRVGASGSWTAATQFATIADTFTIHVSGGVGELFQGYSKVPINGSNLSANLASASNFYAYFAARRAGDLFGPVVFPGGNVPSLPPGWWITEGDGWTQSVSNGFLTLSHAAGTHGTTVSATSPVSAASSSVIALTGSISGEGVWGIANAGDYTVSVGFSPSNFIYQGTTVSRAPADQFAITAADDYSILLCNGYVTGQGPIATPQSSYVGQVTGNSDADFTFSSLSLLTTPNTNTYWDLSTHWGATALTLSRSNHADSADLVYTSNTYPLARFTFEPYYSNWKMSVMGIAEDNQTSPSNLTFNLDTQDVAYIENGKSVTAPWNSGDIFAINVAPNVVQYESNGSTFGLAWRLDASGNSITTGPYFAVSTSSNLTVRGTFIDENHGAKIFSATGDWSESFVDTNRVLTRSVGNYGVQSALNVQYGEICARYESNMTPATQLLLGPTPEQSIGLLNTGGITWQLRAPTSFTEPFNVQTVSTFNLVAGQNIRLRLLDGRYDLFVSDVPTLSGHAWFNLSSRYIISNSNNSAVYVSNVDFRRLGSATPWMIAGGEASNYNLAMWDIGDTALSFINSNLGQYLASLVRKTTTPQVCFTVSELLIPQSRSRSVEIGFTTTTVQNPGASGVETIGFLVTAAGGVKAIGLGTLDVLPGFNASGAAFGAQFSVSGDWKLITLTATPKAGGSPYSNTMNLKGTMYEDLSWYPYVAARDLSVTFNDISITPTARITLSTDASGNTPNAPPAFTPQWVYDTAVWNVTGTMGTGFTIERTGESTDGSFNIYWNVSYETGDPYMTISLIELPTANTLPAKFGFTSQNNNVPNYDFGNTSIAVANTMTDRSYTLKFTGNEAGSGILENRKIYLWPTISGKGTAEVGTDGRETFKATEDRSAPDGMFYVSSEGPAKFFVTISTNAPDFYGSVSGWNGTTTKSWAVRNRTSNVFLRSLTNFTSNAILNTSGYVYPSITFTVSGADNSVYSEVGFNGGSTYEIPTTAFRRALRFIPTSEDKTVYNIKIYEDDVEGLPLGTANSSTVCRIDFSGTSQIRYTTNLGKESECNATSSWNFGESNIRAYATGQMHSNTEFLIRSYAPMDTSGWTLVKNGWLGAGPLTAWSLTGNYGGPQTLTRNAARTGDFAVTNSNVPLDSVITFQSGTWPQYSEDYVDIGISPSKTSTLSGSWIRIWNQGGIDASATLFDLWANGQYQQTWEFGQLGNIAVTYREETYKRVKFSATTNDYGPQEQEYDITATNPGDGNWYFFVRTAGNVAATVVASNA